MSQWPLRIAGPAAFAAAPSCQTPSLRVFGDSAHLAWASGLWIAASAVWLGFLGPKLLGIHR